jgi:hypothetical protein
MLVRQGRRVKRRCEMLRRTMTDGAARQRVLAQVDPADLVGLASALIRIPSFKPEETPVARFLEPFFREREVRPAVEVTALPSEPDHGHRDYDRGIPHPCRQLRRRIERQHDTHHLASAAPSRRGRGRGDFTFCRIERQRAAHHAASDSPGLTPSP